MGAFGTILTSILVFGFLIFIHEFGHYIFARIFKVTITEFSIGMGPKLVWYDSKKTGIRYALSAIPFGGYVAMEGENDGMEVTSSTDDEPLESKNDVASEALPTDKTEERDGASSACGSEEGKARDTQPFDQKPAWQRLIITVAGAAVNIIAGFIAMIIFTAIVNIGTTTVYDFPETELEISSSDSGLMPGDTITKIDGKRVRIADELSYEIMRRGHEPVDVTVVRDGREITLENVVFPTATESGQTFGMMDFRVYGARKGFFEVMRFSFHKTLLMVRMVWESLFDLITGRYTIAAVSGPVGISEAIGTAAKAGGLNLLYITTLISINLGVMNLMPIPALDGGRTVCILAEMVTRKRIPAKIENTINAVGLAILLAFSVFIMIKDVIQLMIG
ncbi:MAG: site-2 protease family protein [Clostridia bacterium]|nr:site-2 protease family protein [Clostridia bacterium]